jgi:hypothetical protein
MDASCPLSEAAGRLRKFERSKDALFSDHPSLTRPELRDPVPFHYETRRFVPKRTDAVVSNEIARIGQARDLE